MKIRWMVWVLLFALFVVFVSAKGSSSSKNTRDTSKDSDKKWKVGSNTRDKDKKWKTGSNTRDKDKKWKTGSNTRDKDKKWKTGSNTRDSDKKWKTGSNSRDSDKKWKTGSNSRDSDKKWKTGSNSRDSDKKWKTGSNSRGRKNSGRSSSGSRDRDGGKAWDIFKKGGKFGKDSKEIEKFKKNNRGGWKKNKDWSQKVDYGCKCSAKGDPHFTSCDGLKYDFQGDCTYTLVRDGCQGKPQTFEVLISTEPWKKSKATVTKEVRINFFENGEKTFQLRFDRKSGECYRNDVKFTLPNQKEGLFSAKYDRNKVVVLFDNGKNVRLEWNYDHNVEVKLGDEFREGICGLCGNYNGVKNDDFVLPNGEVVDFDKHNKFGEAWRAAVASNIGECAPEVVEDYDPCKELSPEGYQKVQNFCGQMATGGFAVCYDSNAVLKGYIDELIKDCVFDFCLDIRNEELQCSYPQDCADTCLNAGFPVGIWQRRGFCGDVKCPENKVFRENVVADKTCSDPWDEPQGIPTSGCFCPENMYLEGARCVTFEACGCSLDGQYLQRGERKLVNNCRTLLKCKDDGEMEVDDVAPCGENAKCGKVNGIEQCVCTDNTEKIGDRCVAEKNTIGVEQDGELPESSFKSSSEEDGTKPWDGRLNNDRCWKPESSDDNPWLEVALLEEFKINGVRLQSCKDGDCSISEFTVYYRKAGGDYKKGETFTDVNLEAPHSDFMLANPVKGVTHIKIYPKNKDGCIGLRMDVIALRSNCHERMKPALRSCYYLGSVPKDKDGAQQVCRDLGAYLVEIFNQKENDYITELADGKHVFLGISYLNGAYTNEHGWQRDAYLNFPGNHEVRDGHHSVEMRADGQWSDIKSSDKLHFVCESGGSNYCPVADGWTKINGGCYKFIDQELSFEDAIEKCAELHGHVVEIASGPENEAVTKVSKGSPVWIGISDLQEEGIFRILSSQKSMPFTAWAGNEPNDYGDGEDCAISNWRNSDGQWNDVPCMVTNKMVCEYGVNQHHQILDVCKGDKCNGGDCFGYYNHAKEEAEFVCKCKNGKSGPTCNEAECNCFAWGDPHFGTCDGDKYDYQGKCSYVMAQDGCKNPLERTFQIVISTQDFPKYPGTTSTKAVYIHLDYVNGHPTTIIRLDQLKKVFRNDVEIGADISLTSKAQLYPEGGKVVFTDPRGIKILWNGERRVDIKLSGSMFEKVCGMCGNFNGIQFDDIIDENNNGKFDNAEILKFGDTWAYGEKCTPPELPEPIEKICEDAPEDVRFLLKRAMEIIDGEDFEKCRPLINVAEVKHGLKMDFCPTGSMQSLCDGLKSLQEECQAKAHILVCWEDRTNLMCAPPPRKNERYVCGYGGEKRCGQLVDGPLAELLFLETVEGNFCEEGFFRNGDGECVTLVDCGCKYSNSRGERASLRPESSAMDPSCKYKYDCVYSEEKKKYVLLQFDRGCHADATCFNGECRCNANYEGDGYVSCKRIPTPDIEGIQLGVRCGGIVPKNAITRFPEQESKKAGRLCQTDDFFIPDPAVTDPYIQVKFPSRTRITGFFTRGWFEGNCWADFVVVRYSNNLDKPEDEWDCVQEEGSEGCKKYPVSYEERLTGVTPFKTKYVRIYPGVKTPKRLCLQIELFGGNEFDCPEGFVKTPVGCYHKADTAMTYDDGVSYCALRNGYIVEISSYRESRAVEEIAEGNYVFLGLRDVDKSGVFRNPKGSPNIYSNYGEGEPNVMRVTAECIRMEEKLWYRTDCSELHTIVCEFGGDALIRIPDGRPLGVGFTGGIPNTAFTASSYIEQLPPYHGRLFMPGDNSAWCATPEDQEPFLQVDLTTRFKITAVVTQGRGDASEYTKKFTIKYSGNDCENFETFQDEDGSALVFSANDDRNTRVFNIFEKPFKARCVRIYPVFADNEVPICLRFELYGKFVKPDKPCFISFFARGDGDTSGMQEIPDKNLISSSCEQVADDPNPDENYCAAYARWSEDWENGLWWSPGVNGHHEFIQINLGEERVVTAIRLAVRQGPLPEFRLSCSTDGIKWACCDYKRDKPATPRLGGEVNVYELVEWTPLRYIRINPVCDDIPELRIDIKGCPMK